jgi:DnaJ-class molecular chaperone
MKKIPVYKICTECQGTGIINIDYYHNDYSNVMSNPQPCAKCNGTGKEKTDMFIEDPYSLFDFE